MLIVLPLVLSLTLAGAPAQRLTPAQHAQAGWDALNGGRVQEAAAAFDQALRGAPREPTVLLGAGAAAHLLGQPEVARHHLAEALKYNPALTPHRCCWARCSTASMRWGRQSRFMNRRWCTRPRGVS